MKWLLCLLSSTLAYVCDGADATGFMPDGMFESEDEVSSNAATVPDAPPSSSVSSAEDDFSYDKVANTLFANAVQHGQWNHVQEGHYKFFFTEDCLEVIAEESPFGYRSNCWVQNPGAPYGLIMLPLHRDEKPDEFWGFPVHDDDGTFSSNWHLKENEAIVLLGETPPACKYFSFTNYLYSRHMPADFEPPPSPGPRYPTCLPGNESTRCEMFASVADTVNMDRGLELGQGSKFEASFALVISPSQRATEEAVGALIESGAPRSRISNFSYPGANLTLGVESEADSFTTILRTAFYENQTEASDYFDRLPFRVLRLELDMSKGNDDGGDDDGAAMDMKLYPRKVLVPRVTGQPEGTTAGLSRDDMQNATNELALRVMQTIMGSSDADDDAGAKTGSASSASTPALRGAHGGEQAFGTARLDWDVSMSKFNNAEGTMDNGFDCIDNNIRCLADCRDTLYPFTSHIYARDSSCETLEDLCKKQSRRSYICDNHQIHHFCRGDQMGRLSESEDDVILVVGVNHAMANMSGYSSLSVYDQPTLWGVMSVGDEDMRGTAEQYVSPDDDDISPELAKALPFLFAYQIKRNCSSIASVSSFRAKTFATNMLGDEATGCLEIPSKPSKNNSLFVPLDHPIVLAERMYNNPLSHVGPDYSEIVHSVQIHMTRKSSAAITSASTAAAA